MTWFVMLVQEHAQEEMYYQKKVRGVRRGRRGQEGGTTEEAMMEMVTRPADCMLECLSVCLSVLEKSKAQLKDLDEKLKKKKVRWGAM